MNFETKKLLEAHYSLKHGCEFGQSYFNKTHLLLMACNCICNYWPEIVNHIIHLYVICGKLYILALLPCIIFIVVFTYS